MPIPDLYSGPQLWTQNSSRIEQRGRITSFDLLTTLPNAAQEAVGLLCCMGTLLAGGQYVIHHDIMYNFS